MRTIYLDHNATTPLDPRVLDAMLPYLREHYGNPSSIYQIAQTARAAVDRARESVAALLNADPSEIIFTGGGSEADNTAVKGIAWAQRARGTHIITSKIEHHAVLHACRYLEREGFTVTYLPVDHQGVVDLAALAAAFTPQTILVSVMHANNEVGTIQPIAEIARLCRDRGVPFHTDAVQTVGKLPLDVRALGIDLLALSAHKFYGPKGTGVLYLRKGIKLEPLIHGGGHERNRRAGTENVAGIVGLGAACEIARTEMAREEAQVRALRDDLWQRLAAKIPDLLPTGHPVERLAGTLSFCIRYIEGESVLLNLDFEGICASSGSACTSGSLEPSHVLLAMGLEHEVAHGSLRLSFGRGNTAADVDRVVEVLPGIVAKLRALSPLYPRS